jgi:CubicO group peptidase (beta-lactamase class C family)
MRKSRAESGIISTVGNLQRWNRCLHGVKLLKALTYRAMITPTPSAKRSHRWGVLGYGLGIQVSAREDLLELSHSGYVPGYISTLIYYPQQQVSVVVLENTAWLTSDISRVFSVHDRLREIIRNMIMGWARQPVP